MASFTIAPLTDHTGVEVIGLDFTSSDPSFDFSEAALASLTPAPPLLPRRPEAPQDNRALFIEAMADPSRRRIAFNVLEKNCRRQFAEGDDGIRLYLQLLDCVRSANVGEAVDEFEHRFEPMLDQERLKETRPYLPPRLP
jgi:hypothetical protein